jgi:hypothetical protein
MNYRYVGNTPRHAKSSPESLRSVAKPVAVFALHYMLKAEVTQYKDWLPGSPVGHQRYISGPLRAGWSMAHPVACPLSIRSQVKNEN